MNKKRAAVMLLFFVKGSGLLIACMPQQLSLLSFVMRQLFPFSLILLFASCQMLSDAPVPNLYWDKFEAPGTQPLTVAACQSLEGVYQIQIADDDFGDSAVLKWTYDIQGRDTLHYLSFFCSEDVRFFILQGRSSGNTVLLNGYWRNIENTKTGKARFTITKEQGAFTVANNPVAMPDSVLIDGAYGMGEDEPQKKISFRRHRDLHRQSDFYIIAHRGGGRNNDLLPASENSLEMIHQAARMGANGVEIDIKLTSDAVPVVYHDKRINDRLTQKSGIHGMIKEHSYPELEKEVKLKRGGKIPTLRDALHTIVYNTPLEFIWLDCKFEGPMNVVQALQQEYRQKAKAIGRTVAIAIGVPDDNVYERFRMLPQYGSTLSLCELDQEKAMAMQAEYWATLWIKGLQTDDVKRAQANGMKVFAFTLDVPVFIRKYMRDGHFNGLVSNRPSAVAYEYYSRP